MYTNLARISTQIIIVLTLLVGSAFAIPQPSDQIITIDEGIFDINLLDDNFIVYSDKETNLSKEFERTLFYIYDFEREEKRSFGRFTRGSEFYKIDNDSVYIIEPSRSNIQNNSLSDYNVAVYEKVLSTNDRNLIDQFPQTNFTRYYFDFLEAKENDTFLLEVLDFQFKEYDNDTGQYSEAGESYNFYRVIDNNFERIDRLTYANLKKTQPLYENSKFVLSLNDLTDKNTGEIFDVDLPQNKVCGISSNFIYYASKLYYESALKPLSILVKYDYRNDIRQEIIIQDSCDPGKTSFYANPYLYDLSTDTYNILPTDDSEIEVLDGKVVFIDDTLEVVYVELEEQKGSTVLELDENETLVNESINESEELIKENEDKELELIVKDSLDDETVEVILEETQSSSLSDLFTTRNIILGIIIFEVFLMMWVVWYFLTPHKEPKPKVVKEKKVKPQKVKVEKPKKVVFKTPKRQRREKRVEPTFTFNFEKPKKKKSFLSKISFSGKNSTSNRLKKLRRKDLKDFYEK